jgi:hypothetical protein
MCALTSDIVAKPVTDTVISVPSIHWIITMNSVHSVLMSSQDDMAWVALAAARAIELAPSAAVAATDGLILVANSPSSVSPNSISPADIDDNVGCDS